jgi:membrane protein DedA with SNARE-associated domain
MDLFIFSIAALTYSGISTLLYSYSYIAIIFLMALESASMPIPSEVLLPLVGKLSTSSYASFHLNPYVAFTASVIGTAIGISIDYAIAYYLEKDIVYKHMDKFHISKKSLDSFDSWFSINGAASVFFARLVPVMRGLISFPAGFAKMELKRFYIYSILGSMIWNAVLIGFGYYALSSSNPGMVLVSIAAFGIVLYLIYRVASKKIRSE